MHVWFMGGNDCDIFKTGFHTKSWEPLELKVLALRRVHPSFDETNNTIFHRPIFVSVPNRTLDIFRTQFLVIAEIPRIQSYDKILGIYIYGING